MPALTNEGNATIEHYPSNLQEIIPGLELTLAKRIMRPGSNRVVCLAARTSVPLNDDELASVSDVALKLSDGTNVRLSVSLFNDLAGAGYAPFKHYIYDPSRYATRTDPRSGVLILAMLVLSSAGFYSMSTESSRRLQWQALVNAYQSRSSLSVPAVNAVHTSTKSVYLKDKEKSLPTISEKAKENVKGANPANGNLNRRLATKTGHAQAKAIKANSFMRESTLIPPPPPVPYSLPDRSLLFQYDPAQLIKPAYSPSKEASSPKSSVKNRELPTSRSLTSSAVQMEPDKISLPPANKNEQKLERIPAFSSAPGRTAPLPGTNSNFSTLERIVLPEKAASP